MRLFYVVENVQLVRDDSTVPKVEKSHHNENVEYISHVDGVVIIRVIAIAEYVQSTVNQQRTWFILVTSDCVKQESVA